MLHDMMPGTEELLLKGPTSGYIGFDPTSESLHIGSLVQIMTLVHFQRCGHKPIALVGGATGMVGDPSGKSKERNLLSADEIEFNLTGIRRQLSCFLDFEKGRSGAELVNNYDWFKDLSFLDFIRDVGKHITVNYMMAKDSVKKRLDRDSGEGMSFTEFSYQLVQGYDFYWLYKNKGCRLQLGGSDQWGNILTGTELIRRKEGGEAYAITTPLITKADGSKFGKTEGGNVWLDARRTSPYKFYQYWLNAADEDAAKYLRIFSLFSREYCDELIARHAEAPHLRQLQKSLAADITQRVHGAAELAAAERASAILFGQATEEALKALSAIEVEEIFEGVPQAVLSRSELEAGLDMVAILSAKSGFLASNGEARRALAEHSISLNKKKVDADYQPVVEDILAGRFLLLQRGKKQYFLLRVE
jgi:tyrosyl-tRNA synthetase